MCIAPPAELTGDARANLERLPGAAPLDARAAAWPRSAGRASIVDALLGTGFAGEPRGTVVDAIDGDRRPARRRSSAWTCPSGVDASTGVVAGAAVHAAATVTFHAAKPGLWIHPGKAHAGEVEVLDIGIPRGAPGGRRRSA